MPLLKIGCENDDFHRTGPMTGHFRFEKLDVWQEARVLNRALYAIARKFPKDEMFAMTSQLRRAATSVSSNIAEGSGRNSDKDFAHFLEQAYGSLMEAGSLCFLAFDEGYVTKPDLEPVLGTMQTLANRVAALNRSLSVETSKTPFAPSHNRGRQ